MTDPSPPHDQPPPTDARPPHQERPIPRGCHPLVFGVVMATIQLVATLYFMGWC